MEFTPCNGKCSLLITGWAHLTFIDRCLKYTSVLDGISSVSAFRAKGVFRLIAAVGRVCSLVSRLRHILQHK